MELLAVKASTAGIDLAAVIEPGFDGRFRGDPSRLRQVVVNLLSNAIKFTARGSVVARVARSVGVRAGRHRRAHRGHGHGHRHDAGGPGPPVPAVRAGRGLDDPATTAAPASG